MAFVLEVPVNLLGRQHNLVSFSMSIRPTNYPGFSRKQRCQLSISATLNDAALPIMVLYTLSNGRPFYV